uniref:MARVEL domain-containing protein n=1 Tax=Parastrongyloides trichosuri TaxID=131310 RepID=A0A0N4ZAV9_PARTI
MVNQNPSDNLQEIKSQSKAQTDVKPIANIPSIKLTTEAEEITPPPKSPSRKDSTDGEDDNRLFLKIEEGYSAKGSSISYDAVGYHSDAVTSISNQSSPPYNSSSENSPTQRQDLLNPVFKSKALPEKHTFIGKGGSFNIFKSDNLLCPFNNSRKNSDVSVDDDKDSTFFNIPIKIASLVLVFSTLIMVVLLISYILFQIKHSSIAHSIENNDHAKLTFCILLIGVIYLVFSSFYVYGLVVDKKKYLLPLIFATISFCVALIGATITFILSTASEINDELTKLEMERDAILELEKKLFLSSNSDIAIHHTPLHQSRGTENKISDIILHRFILICIIIYQIFTVICYYKTYKFVEDGTSDEVVDIACQRNPNLRYCRTNISKENLRRSEPNPDININSELVIPPPIPQKEDVFLDSYEDDAEQIKRQKKYGRRLQKVTPPPARQNILFTVFPTLQKKSSNYCAINEYTFATTCAPGKKLRYDLQVFCDEFSRQCGVPNINEYESKRVNKEYYPEGYGQKQENGHLGLGNSFAMGIGAIPGLTLVGSKGADIGKMPFLDSIGGMMFNKGTDIGILGERVGRGPERTMEALKSGVPSFGLNPETKAADERVQNAALRSLGIPPIPGLAKALGALNKNGKKKKFTGFEPGYDALNKHALIATGKSDGNNVNLPGGMGTVEYMEGVGMGIGKK